MQLQEFLKFSIKKLPVTYVYFGLIFDKTFVFITFQTHASHI